MTYVSPPGACDQCGDEAGPNAHQGCEACGGTGIRPNGQELAERRESGLREALRKACDVAVWMSGSPSFSPGGDAHDGWVNTARPMLNEALAALTEDSPAVVFGRATTNPEKETT